MRLCRASVGSLHLCHLGPMAGLMQADLGTESNKLSSVCCATRKRRFVAVGPEHPEAFASCRAAAKVLQAAAATAVLCSLGFVPIPIMLLKTLISRFVVEAPGLGLMTLYVTPRLPKQAYLPEAKVPRIGLPRLGQRSSEQQLATWQAAQGASRVARARPETT